MASDPASLLREALELPADERAHLAAELLRSLDEGDDLPSPEEHDAAWREELERRTRAIDDGSARLIPWDAVRRELFEK